jgi:hypothetical protein
LRRIFALAVALHLTGCQKEPSAKLIDVGTAGARVALVADAPTYSVGRGKPDRLRRLKGCAIPAISVEQDLKGLNVRSGPGKDNPVLGVLQSLIETDPHTPDDPPLPEDRAFGPSFNITAISGSWVKIADIDPLIDGYDPKARKRVTKRNYQGSGWVHRSRIAVDPGFHDNAYDRPYFEAGNWRSIDRGAGELLTLTGGKQGYSAELLSCEQDWLQLRYQSKLKDGQSRTAIGWFHMRPHYIGIKYCKTDDSDCELRQNPDLWDGPN